jgi:proline racemase
VIPEITGSACLTGLHQFIVDPQDPFPQGFLL